MGNNHQQKTPENYTQYCHQGLKNSSVFKNDLLHIEFDYSWGLEAWRNTIQPLLNNKTNLFHPEHVTQHDPNGENLGCMEAFQHHGQSKRMHAFYQPFIYTLARQIDIRKLNYSFFQEYQIWKILKNCALAIHQWNYIFPNSTIGRIDTTAILFNQKGKIKVVNQLSFPVKFDEPCEFITSNILRRQSTPINNENMPTLILKNQHNANVVYYMGISILETMTMERAPISGKSINSKMNMLMEDNKYSFELKNLIIGILGENIYQRPNLTTIVGICRGMILKLKKQILYRKL